MAAELEELLVADAIAWRQWLEVHHETSPGVWLVLHKKGGTVTELTYDGALNEALCFGWIDGQVQRRDEGSFRERFTPRRPRSPWSARNVGLIDQLRSQGRMHPAGERQVSAAQADGRWEAAYAGSATAEVPPDLAAAVAQNPQAQALFNVLTAQNRYALIFRLGNIKGADTRARRITEYVAMLARGETIYPQKKRP